MFTTRNMLATAAVLVLLASAAAATPTDAHHSPGHGGGGGGGGGGENPPPPALDAGWIYHYSFVNDEGLVYRTSPDGATTETVAGAPADYGCSSTPCGSSIGRPSHDTHDGSRWYVAHSNLSGPDNLFPNAGSGFSGRDIDLVREGETIGTTVLDASATCIQVGAYPVFVSDSTGPDAAIAWPGGQWQDADSNGDCETLVATGVFRADLIYSAGAMVGIESPVMPVQVPTTVDNLADVRAGTASWAPDGSAVAYVREADPDQGIYVGAVGSPPANHVYVADGNFFSVDWSPDQDRSTAGLQSTLAANGVQYFPKAKSGIWTVQPDGSNLTLTVEAKQTRKSSDPDHDFGDPKWSPAGTHLTFVDIETIGWDQTRYLRRITADGGDNQVILTESATINLREMLGWTNVD